tara:strand:- start:3359 stop:4687 length:1329 start_codon:yes stop_codon:yes gene_type:complete
MKEILEQVRAYTRNKENTWRPSEDWVQYAGPYFGEEEIASAVETLLEGWLVLGRKGIKFEKEFPKYLGQKTGVLTNSGSSSNLLAVAAFEETRNIPKNQRQMITPVAGFPTTVNPIIQRGFKPIFVDIELETLNMDLQEVDKALQSNNPSAVTFAHVLGNPVDMDKLTNILEANRRPTGVATSILEDCCDALDSKWDDKPMGSWSEFATCSFYPAHHITMGEGGFVACKEEDERKLRSLRDWGRDCWCVGKANLLKDGMCGKRFGNWLPCMPEHAVDHKYVYSTRGYNLKPIEVQAAMGLEQLKKLPEIKKLRRRNFLILDKVFSQHREFFHLPYICNKKAQPHWFAYPLTIRDNAPFTRNEITSFLEDHKIQTRTYFGGNLLLQPGYQDLVTSGSDPRKDFPKATKATKDTFFLGVSPVITYEQIQYVCEIVEKFMRQFKS